MAWPVGKFPGGQIPSPAALSDSASGGGSPSARDAVRTLVGGVVRSPSKILTDEFEQNLRAPLKESIAAFTAFNVLPDAVEDGIALAELVAKLSELKEVMSQFVNRFMDDSKRLAAQSRPLESAAAASDPHPRASQPQKSNPTDIVHDFRNPLHNIAGSLDLLRAGSGAAEQMLTLKTCYDHLQSLSRSLRTNGTVLKLELERFTVGDLFSEVRSLTSQIDPNVSIEFVCPDLLQNRPLMGDRVKLRRILVNLISNAIEFSPVVAVSCGIVQELENEVQVRFGVQDQGPGIAKEDQGRLFKRFSQLKKQPVDAAQNLSSGAGPVEKQPAKAARKPSSGVGLAASQECARLMRSTIQIDSDPEQGRVGTLFYFDLSLRQSSMQLDPIMSPMRRRDTSPEPGFSILVADDTDTTLKIFAATYKRLMEDPKLADANFEVDLVRDGAQAVEAYERKQHEVIVLDMHMPIMGGWEAAERILKIAAERGFPTPKVRFCSADPKPPEIADDDFYPKPTPFVKVATQTIQLGQMRVARVQRQSP